MIDKEKPDYLHLCRVFSGHEKLAWNEICMGEGRTFLEMAEAEGAAPMLYWHLKDGRWPVEMPETILGELTRSYYNTVAQNSLLIQELFRVLDVFSQEDIPVIVLKGGALVWFYEDMGLRPMQDLDLLIPDDQLTRALGLIQKMGYCPAEVEISPGINRQVVHNTYWRGGPDGRVGLELHWNLIAGQADDRSVQVDWFWQQVEWLTGKGPLFSSRLIPQLHPTAHLLYVAAHLILRHGGNNERLIWYYDADRLIRSGRVDWESFKEQAHTLGWGAVARYVLEGVVTRFATPIPSGLPESLSTGETWETFLIERRKKIGRLSRLDHTWKSLKHFSWPLRLRMIFALFFPNPNYIRWRYVPHPEWTWPLYYFYRWGEMSKELLYTVLPSG
jgi:hypothetical protein